MTATVTTLTRRTAVVLVTAAGLVAAAGPAGAEVPEGWSDPDDVSPLHALWLLGGIPLALFVLIALAVYLPPLIRGERVAPGPPTVTDQWFGAATRSATQNAGELPGPEHQDTRAGGASVRW